MYGSRQGCCLVTLVQLRVGLSSAKGSDMQSSRLVSETSTLCLERHTFRMNDNDNHLTTIRTNGRRGSLKLS